MRVESVGSLSVQYHIVSHGLRAAGRVVIDPSRLAASPSLAPEPRLTHPFTHSLTHSLKTPEVSFTLLGLAGFSPAGS